MTLMASLRNYNVINYKNDSKIPVEISIAQIHSENENKK